MNSSIRSATSRSRAGSAERVPVGFGELLAAGLVAGRADELVANVLALGALALPDSVDTELTQPLRSTSAVTTMKVALMI